MIDLHCHILPDVDDGPKTMKDSVAMAELAVSEGITHILATPHHENRAWFNSKKDVVRLVDQVQAELDRREIPLTIFPGQEIRLHGEILENIEKDEILFVDEGDQYLLIEFPTQAIPTYTERLFFDLQSAGKTPVIVHPERNHAVRDNPDLLKDLVDRGALTQLTAASYTGGFGKQIQKLSQQLVEANLVHFIASDAHNVTNRTFHMKEAFDLLTEEYGEEKTEAYLKTAKDLINGEVVVPPQAKSVKKKKRFFGLF